MRYPKVSSWPMDVAHNVRYHHRYTSNSHSTKWRYCKGISLMYGQFETSAWFCSSSTPIPEIVCQLLYIWKKTRQNKTTSSTFACLLSLCGLLPRCWRKGGQKLLSKRLTNAQLKEEKKIPLLTFSVVHTPSSSKDSDKK